MCSSHDLCHPGQQTDTQTLTDRFSPAILPAQPINTKCNITFSDTYRQKWKTDRRAQQGVTRELLVVRQHSTWGSCHYSTLSAVGYRTAVQSMSGTCSALQGLTLLLSTLHAVSSRHVHIICSSIMKPQTILITVKSINITVSHWY